ncbi:cell wall integrity and stress response component 4-like [Elysia marginata]|uniref:Cell wall integrity and stress response component 4-like n=1 Tax=Elysia marginata TaxID=1093978 RepID=A0AAV4IED4_9GAST|nr:cell wall integrity and stress response component 4-like [Elysia marginata]
MMSATCYTSFRNRLLCVLFAFLTFTQRSEGHGYMIDPPARSSMWRVGFNTPVNYNDNALRCGGSRTTCGVCGDAVEGPRDHETGGLFATGIIAKDYREGEEINIRVTVTANHQGWFYFHLCDREDASQPETEDCLNRTPLYLADGRHRFPLRERIFGVVNIRVKLPDEVTCSHCVLRWKWITGECPARMRSGGNSWGRDLRTGEGCLGCGPQEQFYGCADVTIRPRNPSASKPEVVEPGPQQPPTAGPSTDNGKVETNAGASNSNSNNNNNDNNNSGRTGQAFLTRKCLAVNNWEGDPELDNWCAVNCNKMAPRFCPSVFCACQLM